MVGDEILEWAKKYCLDETGQPIKLAPWQEELAKMIFDPDVKVIILMPPYGR